ncbi:MULTISPECIES: CHAT domain-containing protein [unclassified Saccharothrix]|uniref:CHAT domain-containing protein n=1 Tax=unclassified Saccharothrix TaxID=2593673 RepID=UPI00307E99FA
MRAPAIEALSTANQAADLALGNPTRARALAEAARAAAGEDVEPVAVAEQALGLAALSVGRLTDAERHLRTAIGLADQAGLAPVAAKARGVLGYVLTLTGRTAEGLREMDRAAPALSGPAAARLAMQRAVVLTEVGRFADAATVFAQALDTLRHAGGDAFIEATIRNNRAILLARLGDWRGAEDDLRRAEEVFTATGHGGRTAMVHQNRGLAASVRGDVPAALAAYDEAARRYREAGTDPGLLPVERAEVLLSVRLVAEARAAADAAVAHYASRRNAVDLVQARLLSAKVALVEGDPGAALAEAVRARRSASRQGRPGWAALAAYLVLRARWELGQRDDAVLRSGRRAVAALTAAGWLVAALDARLIVARLAMETGRRSLARRELLVATRAGLGGPAEVRGGSGGRAAVAGVGGPAAGVGLGGPAEVRARVWHAVALVRLGDGDRRGADAALRAGVRVLDRFRASLGATELRAHASGHADELTGLGLRLAVERGRPESVLRWAERRRAWALRLRPARPPDDAELAADLSRLRQVAVDLAAGGDPRPLLRRQAELERAVRNRARHAAGTSLAAGRPQPTRARHPGGPPAAPLPTRARHPDGPPAAPLPTRARHPDGSPAAAPLSTRTRHPDGAPDAAALPAMRDLHTALGPAALVEYLDLDGRLHAVVVADGRVDLHALSPVDDIARAVADLRFALHHLAHAPRSHRRFTDLLDRTAAQLDAALLAPLLPTLGNRPLVVVPTGPLHDLPWPVLPSCLGRPLSVTPSAALWHRAATTDLPAPGGRVVVAGPDLPHAVAEVDALARRHPTTRHLTGSDARVADVVAALDGADLGHLAAHGRFRADNPLFSALRLADGPLTGYDLERLTRPPRRVVLSACDSGRSAVHPGDEVLGLASVLLALGTTTLVATVVPVPDEATRPLVLRFHTLLDDGLPPAHALAEAQRDLSTEARPADRVAAVGFLCFGAG